MLINPRILLLVPVPVSLSASTSESVPVLAPTSNIPSVLPSESPVLSEIPQSTASWADIVDHIPFPDLSVTVEVPVSRPVVPGGKPPLPPRPSRRVARRKPAPIVNTAVPTRKPP